MNTDKLEQAYFEQFIGEDEQQFDYIYVFNDVSLKSLQEMAYKETIKEMRRLSSLGNIQAIKISDLGDK